MRFLPLLLIVSAVSAANSIDVLVPGLSYHPDWDEAGKPNPFNYGVGLTWTHTEAPTYDDWAQYQFGGMVYNDSFSELGTVLFAGMGVRSPTVVSWEILVGASYWNGSGIQGAVPFWYTGVGYQQPTYAVFVDATYTGDVAAAWLKFSIPIND